MSAGYVYFAVSGEWTKIGFTSGDPKSRVDSMKTGNPLGPYLIGWIQSEDALDLEKKLHDAFADKRGEGEWFKIDDADLTQISQEEDLVRGDIEDLPPLNHGYHKYTITGSEYIDRIKELVALNTEATKRINHLEAKKGARKEKPTPSRPSDHNPRARLSQAIKELQRDMDEWSLRNDLHDENTETGTGVVLLDETSLMSLSLETAKANRELVSQMSEYMKRENFLKARINHLERQVKPTKTKESLGKEIRELLREMDEAAKVAKAS